LVDQEIAEAGGIFVVFEHRVEMDGPFVAGVGDDPELALAMVRLDVADLQSASSSSSSRIDRTSLADARPFMGCPLSRSHLTTSFPFR